MTAINWAEAKTEALHHLVELLKLDTTNPPGNETLAANYLAQVLHAEGIDSVLLEYAPGRGNIVARLKGTGEAAPVLLYGHTDVVPAEPQYWTHPPFGGVVADGYVWGRGTADMKGIVAQQLMVFLLLKRSGIPLKRDVIFAATADEEMSGDGIRFLVQHHPDLIRAEWGITEVGGFPMYVNGRRFYAIQTAEKGVLWLKARATGKPGHASIPHGENAVVHLARAIAKLGDLGLPHHLTAATEGLIDTLKLLVDENEAAVLEKLKSAYTYEDALRLLSKNEARLALMLNSLLRNTATPTGLRAGSKVNVIPSQAEAIIDCRMLPGFDPAMTLDEIRAVMGPEFEFEVIQDAPPLETSANTPLFQMMKDTLIKYDAQAAVGPYMLSGATDAKYAHALGTKSYGFSPIWLPPELDFEALMHAHDERIPVDGFGWGVQVLFDVVRDFAQQG